MAGFSGRWICAIANLAGAKLNRTKFLIASDIPPPEFHRVASDRTLREALGKF
jgi:hypothetical protein